MSRDFEMVNGKLKMAGFGHGKLPFAVVKAPDDYEIYTNFGPDRGQGVERIWGTGTETWRRLARWLLAVTGYRHTHLVLAAMRTTPPETVDDLVPRP